MGYKLTLAAPLTFDSIVDGEGLRIVVWCQGCPHHCKGCQNPQTHSNEGGIEYEIETLIKEINEDQLADGITLSGGEPFQQVIPLLELVKAIKNDNFTIWAYSGYTFEELLNDSLQRQLLEEIDVLVDGKFIIEEYEADLSFKGSKNQRVIAVKASIRNNKIIVYEM